MHVRLIRVFVSSPGDVKAERKVLDEVVKSVNKDTGHELGYWLELFRWEEDVVPQIGPKPQKVVDDQTPLCDIYLGILAHRFGTKTGRYASGTEKEFRDALNQPKPESGAWSVVYMRSKIVNKSTVA